MGDIEKLGNDKSSKENPQLEKRFFTFLLSKKVPPIPSDDSERQFYRETHANFISRVFLWWLAPIYNVGYKRTLTEKDLFKLTDDLTVCTLYERFEKIYNKRMRQAKEKFLRKKYQSKDTEGELGSSIENELKHEGNSDLLSDDREQEALKDFKPSTVIIVMVVIETLIWDYFLAALFGALGFVGIVLNPLQTKKLINFVERKALGIEESTGKGVGYAIGTGFVVLVTGLLMNHQFLRGMMMGAKLKGILTKALLEKSFKLSQRGSHEFPQSKITSIMGTDLSRIDFACGFQTFLIIFPIPIGVAIAILIVNIGPTSLIGVAIILVFLLFLFTMGKKFFSLRKNIIGFTDSRVNMIKEVLYNIKIIKLHSWEIPYFKIISDIRRKELKLTYRVQLARNLLNAVAVSLTPISSMVTFVVLYYTDSNNSNPASLFSSLSLFTALTQQVFMLPMALATGADAYIGLQRVQNFLEAHEGQPPEKNIEPSPNSLEYMRKENISIMLSHASFEWETFDDDDTEKEKSASANHERQKVLLSTNKNFKLEETRFPGLRDVDLKIKLGEFLVITGVIGSGKSSLLQAMLGVMKCTSGKTNVDGSIILCGTPWIQSSTVKENIVFGSSWDSKWYNEVVYNCSLESDLALLPAGDMTEIGERGVTLSGGQKARISLARAVYANRDIILLDDVLSAVDARVGKHIMCYCLLGQLRKKTRVLATHQLSLIREAHRVLFLNGDGSIDLGTLDELKNRNAGFRDLMAFSSSEEEMQNESQDLGIEPTEVKSEDSGYSNIEAEDEKIPGEDLYISETTMTKLSSSPNGCEEKHRDFNANNTEEGKLYAQEERAVNQMSFTVYKDYVKNGSGIFKYYSVVPINILLIAMAIFCQLFTNTWLSFWSENKFPGKSSHFYIGIYIMFAFLTLFINGLQFNVLSYMTNTASKVLNILAMERILYAPMSYIDTTPMGRIINRFTKDTDVLDNELGDQLRLLSFMLGMIVGVLILCIVYLPWFAIAIPIIFFMFFALTNYYQASAREVKRLEATQRSLVYNNFNETLTGLPTISAYRATTRFIHLNDYFVDITNEAYYISIASQRWISNHLDLVALVVILVINLLCVFRVFNISAASSGLLVSYVIQISSQLSMTIRVLTQFENEMNSVERLCGYAYRLPSEAKYIIDENAPPPDWPHAGYIKFENVSMAYRPNLPLALRNLDIEIMPTQKIGVCGRTGAGKSSLISVLFRISELSAGRVEIDGVDISKIGLHNLRSKLSIIPQEPVLFRGNIRRNMDPFNEYSDDTLWNALTKSGLIEESKIDYIKKQRKGDDDLHKYHLEQNVENDGANFSLGEKQLLSFAKALVKQTKILVLDEATSSVDYGTDERVQANISTQFNDRTIICIAHRLKTIVNYDKILVLERGEVKEFDTPWTLFNKKGGIFLQMCEKSDITAKDFVKKS